MRKIKLSIILAIVAASLTIAVGAVPGQAPPSQGDVSGQDVAPVAFTYTGRDITVAVSVHGNIVQFESPTGFEHIGVGAFSEGYVFCYTAPGTGDRVAVDTGGFDNGVFGGATLTSNAVIRHTDGPNGDGGKVQLRQSYSFGGSDRRLTITNRLTNLTNETLTNVLFRRQVDFDIDTGGASGWAGFLNDFATDGNDRVTAWNTPGEAPSPTASHSMSLRAREAGAPHDARVTAFILDDSCDANSAVSPDETFNEVDYGATLRYHIGTLGPKKTVEISVMYER